MSRFVPVAQVAEIPPGTGRVVDADGVEVAVFNVDGVFHALENACASGGPIGEGTLRGAVVTCPWDGDTYDVRTGVSPASDAIFVKRFPIRVDRDGTIAVQPEPTDDEDL